MNWTSLVLVFLGGGTGCVLRYLVGVYAINHFKPFFPWSTLAVNLLGCFLIGLILGIAERNAGFHRNHVLLLTAGFCGGFTTFSAFAQESTILMSQGQYALWAGYIGGSVFLGLWLNALGLKMGGFWN